MGLIEVFRAHLLLWQMTLQVCLIFVLTVLGSLTVIGEGTLRITPLPNKESLPKHITLGRT